MAGFPRRLRPLTIALALLCALWLPRTSATTAQPDAAVRRGGNLTTVLTSAPIGNFDPMIQSDSGSSVVTSNVFEPLVRFDAGYQPVPWLAESIEQPDELTYVIHVRRGVRFQDGTDLEAEAVAFSIDRVRNNPNAIAYEDAQMIAEAEVLDRYTYRMRLREPSPLWLLRLSGRLGVIVSPAAVRRQGDADFNLHPVGTGPFRLASAERNTIRMVAFTDYWRMGADNRPLPYLDGVTVRVIPGADDRLSALQSGGAHIADLPIAWDEETRADFRLRVAYSPDGGFGYSGLALSIDHPPFDNKALRQALAYALDRDALNLLWYAGGRRLAHGPIPPVLAWAVDPEFQPYPYDPERARAKLAEGGMPDGFDFEAWTTDAGAGELEIMAAGLAKLNIRMQIRTAPLFATVIEKATNRESNAYLYGLSSGIDPDLYVSPTFRAGGAFNRAPYDNPRVNELIQQARGTSNRAVRAPLYHEIVRLIMDDVPYIFSFYSLDRFVGRSNVQGWHFGIRATTGYSEYWLSVP